MKTNNENTCNNCSYPIKENFCPNCGLPVKLHRINKAYALQEVSNLFGYEKGYLYTFRELLFRPGQTIRDFLTKNRQKYTKPVTFLIIASALYTYFAQYLKVETVFQEKLERGQQKLAGSNAIHWIQDNYGYSNVISALFIIFWLKLFFRKHNYNFYELAVLLFFVMGESMIFSLLIPINTKYFGSATIESVITTLVFAYLGWAIGQFFGDKFINYLKAIFAYILGFMTFIILVSIAGVLYETMLKGK